MCSFVIDVRLYLCLYYSFGRRRLREGVGVSDSSFVAGLKKVDARKKLVDE